jgi:hypothetical protein
MCLDMLNAFIYTAENQGIVLSPICIPEKVGVKTLMKNGFSIKKGGGRKKPVKQH